MKQLFHITPFDVTGSAQPILSIRVGEKYCSFAIADFASHELKQLAYYGSEEINESFLNELFSAYSELGVQFYQVLVCYDYPWSTLVPVKHYKFEDAGLFLKSLYGINGTMTVLGEPVEQWQLYNIYAIPKEIHNCIVRRFPEGKCWHNYSVTVRSITGTDADGSILVDLGTNDFTLIAGKENKLLLAQNFSYSIPGDVIYYLLKVCQQLDLSQQEVKLMLSGLIEKQSALYKELHQYFLNIKFRQATWKFPVSSKNEYPAHFFTSLNDLVQCAS